MTDYEEKYYAFSPKEGRWLTKNEFSRLTSFSNCKVEFEDRYKEDEEGVARKVGYCKKSSYYDRDGDLIATRSESY